MSVATSVASAFQTEDIKPRIAPFPLDVEMTEPTHKQTEIKASSSQDITPHEIVKREASPVSVGGFVTLSPIYISSDSDDDEVDAQMDDAKSHGGSNNQRDDEDEEEDEGEGESEGDGENQDKDKGTDKDVEKDTAHDPTDDAGEDRANNKDEEAVVPELEESKPDSLGESSDRTNGGNAEDQLTTFIPLSPRATQLSMLPPRASSTSLSPSPFKNLTKLKTRPTPKPSSRTQSAITTRKKQFISASQPVQSSKRSLSRSGVPSEPHAGGTSMQAIDEHSEDDGGRYAKRARTGTNSAGPSSGKAIRGRTRHKEHWLLDGSVVLLIGTTMFRLHRSRLCSESEYFKQRLTTELVRFKDDGDEDLQETGTSGYVEGQPVYKVKGVSVQDFAELLVALDKAKTYILEPPGFFQLSAILRASRVLAFPDLDAIAMHYLRGMWPAELEKLTETPIKYAAETIILARECGAPELLKRAFYELLRKPQLGEDEDADVEDPEVVARQISRQDLVRLIKTREQLISRWIWAANKPFEIPCPLPQTEPPSDAYAKCKAARAQHWRNDANSSLYEDCLYDPILGLQSLASVDWAAMGYCAGCIETWKGSWAAQRVKLWQQLDMWLGLPSEVSGEGREQKS